MKHITPHGHSDVTLVFYIKNHHLYPIQDARLKQIAKKANQSGADYLWCRMTDMKWSNKSSNYIMYQQLIDNDLIAEPEFVPYDESQEPINDNKDKQTKLTLATIEDHVIILPPDTKFEPVIEKYVTRTNYFVEYLHFDNNGRLDGFMDHKNMYVLNNDYEIRKSICTRLHKIYKSYDFNWCNQSYTSLASSLFKHTRGYLRESQYDNKTREVLDDFYPRALQWCSKDPAPENLTSLDISKCYPSMLINNKETIPLNTIHDIIEPFDSHQYCESNGEFMSFGEYYIDECVLPTTNIKIEAGFYSVELVRTLLKKFNMPLTNVQYQILCRQKLKHDTFKNYLTEIFTMFPESHAKLLANSFIGELGRKHSRKKSGFLFVSQWIQHNVYGHQD